MAHAVVVRRFFEDNEAQPLIKRTGSRVGSQNGKDGIALMDLCLFKKPTDNDRTEAAPLIFGRYAQRV